MKKLVKIVLILVLIFIVVKNRGFLMVYRYANAIRKEIPNEWDMNVLTTIEGKRCLVYFRTGEFYAKDEETVKNAYVCFDNCVRAARAFLEEHSDYYLNNNYSLEIEMYGAGGGRSTHISNGGHSVHDEFYYFAPNGTENLSCMYMGSGKLSYLKGYDYIEGLILECEIDDYEVFRKFKNLKVLCILHNRDFETDKERKITEDELKKIKEYLPGCEIISYSDLKKH